MLRLCLALLLVAATTVLAQSIPPAPMETVWEGMFAPPYIQNPQIMLTIDSVSSNLVYVGGASSGAGAGVFQYDGKMNGNLYQMPMPNQSAMVFDVVVGGTEANPVGVFTSVDLFEMVSRGIQYLAENGKEWLASLMPIEFVWNSQSLCMYPGTRTFIALGDGVVGNNLMISPDGGRMFGAEPMTIPGTNNTGYANCSFPNFLATPSQNRWYLTWGAEPASKRDPSSSSSASSSMGNQDTYSSFDSVDAKYYDAATETLIGKKHMGRTLMIANLATKKTRVHVKTPVEFYADKKAQQLKADSTCNFYSGSIFTSTNQGKSWTKLYENDAWMVDEITCFDETHCTAISFNADDSATLVTVDGKTWQTTYVTPTSTSVSAEMVQAVGYASQTEVWVGGSKQSQAGGKGMFWSSTNSGQTFTPYKHYIPDIMAIMGITFAPDGTGFAAGMTEFKTSQIMRYKKQADYGNFIQSQCPTAGCNFLCQNMTFPQGVCLSTNGGSAKAFCTATGVEQFIYETTSCVGSYTIASQPINQCLNATGGSFFENYCPTGNGAFAGSRKATAKDQLLH